MNIRCMTELDLSDKRVLIREDFNVPLQGDVITNDARLRAALPTINTAIKQGASVILMSHLGRPQEGEFNRKFSLAPIAKALSELLGQPVKLVSQLNEAHCKPGEVILLENTRFLKGEKNNDETLAKQMAVICDVFVMDAFATSHRAQASTHGVACFAPVACAGLLLKKELDVLTQALENPAKPLLAIVGGAKVSTKLTVLRQLAEKVDQLIVGGGIANTFIRAAGYAIGNSLVEESLIDEAQHILQAMEERGAAVPIPADVVVASEFSETASATVKPIDAIEPDEMILDIGPQTIAGYQSLITRANTIVWNGPVGVFEFPQFAAGTQGVGEAIARSDAFSIAGGGDTIAAIEQYQLQQQISYISTGGGAFLEFLEGKSLPGIEVLQQRAHETIT